MLLIKTPSDNLKERQYVIQIIFDEFLEIEFCHEIGAPNYEITLENNNKLIIEDHFFSRNKNNLDYLKPDSLPAKIEYTSNDFVIGSRYVKDGSSDYVGYRNMISRLANKLCRSLLNIPFDEFTTNFRLYNYKCLKVLNESSLKSDNYSSQIEFLFYIYRAGLKCIEVPISFKDRYKGNSKIPKLQILYSGLKLIELFIKNIIIPKKKL